MPPSGRNALQVKLDSSRTISKKPRIGKNPAVRRGGPPSCYFRIELTLDVTLGHLGGGQHASDLAGLSCGVEFLQALFAELGHRFHRGLEIFARIEFLRIVLQDFSDLPG